MPALICFQILRWQFDNVLRRFPEKKAIGMKASALRFLKKRSTVAFQRYRKTLSPSDS